MAHLLDSGVFSIVDTDGSLGVGWKLNFYITGTSTRKNTYPTEADADAATNANTNPVIVGADGRIPPIWLLDNADYKLILTDENDVVKKTIDPVSPAGGVGVTLSGAQTLTNKTFGNTTQFALNGGRVGMTASATALTPLQAILHILNDDITDDGAAVGLHVVSKWRGTTGAPYINNDNTLFVVYNDIVSDSLNLSWSISANNAHNNIPAGVTDSGTRVGVLGWATSVNVAGYSHEGTLDQQYGIQGAAGFQGAGVATGVINQAVGVRGIIYADNDGASIVTAQAGVFASDGVGLDGLVGSASVIQNNYAIYARAKNGTVSNYSFYGELGVLRNEGNIQCGGIIGSTASQSSPTISGRKDGNGVEFGNTDPLGYGSNLGGTFQSGFPFLAFCAEADPTGDTFRTRGFKGAVIWSDLSGDLIFSRLPTASAAGQSLTEICRFDENGHLIFPLPTYADNAAAVSGGLNTSTFYKTSAGEVRIVV